MKLRTGAIALFTLSLMGVLCCFTLRHYCYILFSGQRTSDPEFVSYRLDDERHLVIGRGAALIINTRQQVVVSLGASYGRRLGPVLLWPHDARGVVLGDGVKGDVEDSYHFVDGGVDIRYRGTAAKRDLHVTL